MPLDNLFADAKFVRDLAAGLLPQPAHQEDRPGSGRHGVDRLSVTAQQVHRQARVAGERGRDCNALHVR